VSCEPSLTLPATELSRTLGVPIQTQTSVTAMSVGDRELPRVAASDWRSSKTLDFRRDICHRLNSGERAHRLSDMHGRYRLLENVRQPQTARLSQSCYIAVRQVYGLRFIVDDCIVDCRISVSYNIFLRTIFLERALAKAGPDSRSQLEQYAYPGEN